ncbi:hypothetical protein EGW08_017099 [Elysia chlorotica]|uniref:Uncharacterized protein n=1 Tax=Elysia chlorotica TaxID=188477 RepID=A0A433T0Q9_ELYCH|nr:hypothetical protein EGW08_017099 [Elysia chlorotica]
MSSSTLQLRNYLKENEPEKYEAYLEIQRLLNQQRREKKTEKMATETRMRDTVEAKKGEKELKRKCSRRYRDKEVMVAGTIIKREAASPTPGPVHSEDKQRCDMTPDESRLHDKSKDNMLSKTSKLRKHWKENEPEKYKSYLETQRVKNKQQREKKKEKWETETPTKDMVEAKEREAELKRERNRRYRDKKALEAGKTVRRRTSSTSSPHLDNKRRCDMTPDERRLHDNSVRLLYSHGLSPQEKSVVRRKNRDRMRVVRAGLVTISKLIKPDKL